MATNGYYKSRLSLIVRVNISSTDVIQPTLTLKMTTAQVVEMSVTVNNNAHADDQTQPTFEMTPGFKPFTNGY